MAAHPSWIYGCFGLPWSMDSIYITEMIQAVLVILIVVFAALYLLNEIRVKFFSDKSKCEGCAVSRMNNPTAPRN